MKIEFVEEHIDYNGKKWNVGDIAYEFLGCTYGCLSNDEIAITEKYDEYPFIGVPKEKVKEVTK